jgi:ketosteroid isomerase-like protein
MAEHPDVVLVRRGFEAFSNGDLATLSEIIAEDARQYQPGQSSLAGEHAGRQAILQFYGRLASETDGSFRVELQHLYTDGQGRVVACQRATGQRADRQLDTGAALVFTIMNGQAHDIHGYQEDIDAWDEFWS